MGGGREGRERMRYPAYSNNSSLARSNLLPRVCIDAAANRERVCCYEQNSIPPDREESLGEPVFIVGVEPPCLTSPCLANATRVAGKRLANAILARIRVKTRGYGTDFRVKAKRPYGLVARARLRLVCS